MIPRAILLILIVASAAAPLHAGEGRKPIWEPTTITAPGRYVVVRNITSDAPILQIDGVDGVEIDLNGMRLDGGASPAPVIQATLSDDFVVRDGTIAGGSAAVRVSQSDGVVVEGVQVASSTVAGSDGIEIEGAANINVQDNQVREREGEGITVTGAPNVSVTAEISNNEIRETGTGIRVTDGGSVSIAENTVAVTNVGGGIEVDGADSILVVVNVVEDTGGPGVSLVRTRGCKLYNNAIDRAGAAGLDFGGDDCLILDNVISNSADDGLTLRGNRNHVVGNTFNSNGTAGSGCGLVFFGVDNLYRANLARGNAGCGCAGGPPATNDVCETGAAGSNTSHGDNYMPGQL